jgi:hypothetical protein
MNPYLEQESVWHDFHQSFLPAARVSLAEQLRPKYVVKVEEYVFIHELSGENGAFVGRPDVGVLAANHRETKTAASALAAPAYGNFPATAVDVERHAYLEIRDRAGRELVTVVELISPSNKAFGPDREQYLRKRRQYLASGVRLVELDLLRGGPRLPLEGLPACDYCVVVARPEEFPRVGIWPIGLRHQLPAVPVPLRAPDADATLNIKILLDRVYDGAGYEDYIYATPPQPSLRAEDVDWAKEIVSRRSTG